MIKFVNVARERGEHARNPIAAEWRPLGRRFTSEVIRERDYNENMNNGGQCVPPLSQRESADRKSRRPESSMAAERRES